MPLKILGFRAYSRVGALMFPFVSHTYYDTFTFSLTTDLRSFKKKTGMEIETVYNERKSKGE